MDDDKFLSFILSETPKNGHRAWLDAYDSLRRTPTQVSLFLSSREISGTFIAGIEIYGSRIAHFLQQLLQYNPLGQETKEELDVKKSLTGQIVRRVLLPLLDNEHLHDRDSIFELLVSIIHLADRSVLDLIAARIGEIPRLLAKLISEERNSQFLRAWTNTDPAVMRNWTATAVDLAEQCESDHGIEHELDQWRRLEELAGYLNKANAVLKSSSVGSSSSGLRRLSFWNYSTVSLPAPALPLLDSFGLVAPGSEHALRAAIASLEGPETARIMAAVIDSFPCRPCFQRGFQRGTDARPMVAGRDNTEQRLGGADLASFEGLLGMNLGIWKISLSAQAMKDLRQSKKEGNFHHICEKLEALASGDWVRRSVAKPVPDEAGRFQVRVFQALYGKNGRILWQVDVGFDEKHGKNCQIVRVWRLGDVKEISASLDSVHRAQQTFSPAKVTACKENLISQGKKVPVVFGDSEHSALEDCDPKTTDERTPQDILITGKFHTLTSTVLDSVLHDQYGSDFPFDVTGKEVEIIKHFRTATFILGRSGTGKTSCLLYKLLSRYLVQNLTDSDRPIRQLLLTRSETLARKLEGEVRLLIDTQLLRVKVRTGTGFDDAGGFDDDDADEEGDDRFEITHAMDGTDEDTTEDLFSLQKGDFPLVCTFGHFLKRLENSISANNRRNLSTHGSSAPGTGQLVDFPVFNAAYWQQSTSRSRAGFEPDLVFAEIMGIIKGTTSYISGFRPLTRDEYRAMSSRLAPTFAAEANRDCIYDIFEAYEAKKKRSGDYDAIDRVRVVLDELARNNVLKRRLNGLFEEVYVDEVQDQRPLEIELLLNLVNNPLGIHFAGDSAQCISKDSTFRFANLKALFYEHFSRTGNVFEKHLAKPELFSLARNFRSHQGILSLASFVMDLLWKGFPDLVDKLSPEIGQYLGPKPVVFVGSDIAGLLEMASNSGRQDRGPEQEPDEQQNNRKHKQIVIVRDQKVQLMLQTKLGSGSLVFTILQSKGMEYDDVFLFDFFSGSPCLHGYRSLEELLGPGANPGYGATHMTMCSELKNLYVAITRPRNRLWILESGPTFMLNLFTTKVPKPLVDVRYFTTQTLPRLMAEVRPISATSAREWIETGEQCMERRLFDQALKCFKNANDTRRILWAEGSVAELKGRECRASGDSAGFRVFFGEASRFFFDIGMKERAAGCMEAFGDFAGAAKIWAEKGKHERAAGLFETGELYQEAAKEYHEAGMTSKALQALYNGKVFVQLVRDLHRYRHRIEDGERKVYARECNIRLRRSEIDARHWVDTFNTFITDTEKEEFLQEFKHGAELVELYLARGKVEKAFGYPAKPGEFEKALEMLFDRPGGANLTQISNELQLSQLFKYRQTRGLLASLARSPGVSVDMEPEEKFSASEWSRPWADITTAASPYFKSGIMPKRNDIQAVPWIQEYLDIIVSMRMEYFLRSAKSLTEFPLDYLHGLRELGKNISEHRHFPPALLLCLGVLPIPNASDSYLVLAWSELKMVSSKINGAVVLKKAISYISDIIVAANTAIDQRARALWVDPEQLLECKSCVFRASWSRPSETKTNGSSCSHGIPSEIQFRITVEGTVTLCAFFDNMHKGQPSPETDHWLAKLQDLLTFNSSLLQDAEVITTVSQMLSTLPIYSNVIKRLRMAFPKPTKASKPKEEFAALLDSYRLELMLGINPVDPNPILHKLQPRKPPRKPPPNLSSINAAFNKYQRLHEHFKTHPEQFSAGVFCQEVCNLVEELEKLRKGKKFLSFYNGSVISIYEDILTFLLFSSRTKDVMILKSWTKLYLPQWEPILGATTELERCCYQQSMLRVVASFCDLVADLESTHKGIGKSVEDEMLIRRSVDLLVVSLINIGTIAPPPLRYDEIWGKIQKAFAHPRFKMEETRNIKPNQLPEHIARAFEIYRGKETLLLYVPQERVYKRVKKFGGTEILLVSLPIRPRRRPVAQNLDSTPAPNFRVSGSALGQLDHNYILPDHESTQYEASVVATEILGSALPKLDHASIPQSIDPTPHTSPAPHVQSPDSAPPQLGHDTAPQSLDSTSVGPSLDAQSHDSAMPQLDHGSPLLNPGPTSQIQATDIEPPNAVPPQSGHVSTQIYDSTTPRSQAAVIQGPISAHPQSKPTLQRPQGALLHAAFLIQALRRRQLVQRSHNQLHQKTATGRAIASLQNFCATHRDRKCARVDYLEFVAAMVTDGLELYMLLNATAATFSILLEEPGKLNLPTSEPREAEFEAYKQKIYSPYWYLFVNPTVFGLSSAELYAECKKGIEFVKTLNGELAQFKEILQAESKELEKIKGVSKKNAKGKKKKRAGEVANKANEDGKKIEKAEVNNDAKDGEKGGKKLEDKKDENATKKEGESSKAGAEKTEGQKPTEQQKGTGKQVGKGGSSTDVPWKPRDNARRSGKGGGGKKSRKR